MIQIEINSDDLDVILSVCRGLQFAMLRVSLDLYILQANTVSEAIFLKTEAALIQKAVQIPFHDLDIEFNASNVSELRITEPTRHRLVEDDFYVHWSVSRFLEQGCCTGYVLIGKVFESSFIKNPELQIRNVLRSMPGALYTKNISGEYTYLNDYLGKIAGFRQAKAMLHKTDYDTSWENEADQLRSADALVMQEKATKVLQEYPTLAHGKRVIMLSTKSPLYDDHGNILGIIATSVDVTQQQKMQFSDTTHGQILKLNKDEKGVCLSKKEIECVHWLIKGKSSSEIAIILALSTRTIETHINNIKRKFNCYKQFQLGYILGKYGFLLM